MDIIAAQAKRLNIVEGIKAILAKAESENRADLNTDEQVQYDKMIKDQEDIKRSIERHIRAQELEKELASIPEHNRAVSVAPNGQNGKSVSYRESDAYKAVFRDWIGRGNEALTPECRALSAGVLSEGGALIPPQEFIATLIKAVEDQVFIRQAGTVFQLTSSTSLGAPSMETDVSDADWTTELGTGSEDSSLAFGGRSLTPAPFAKRVKVSETLIRNSALPVEGIVNQRLAYKVAITEEKAYLTGNGANQPLGVFTASNFGIPTSRDVVTGSATGFTFDGLIDAKYTLKGAYWQKAAWMFHRDAMGKIMKLKNTTTNEYLWQPDVRAGQPDRLLDLPLKMSEYVPNTFTTGLYVGMLADWSNYWIADNINFTLKRLVELYAETNQIGFIIRRETDGMPVLAEAFVRMKTS